MHKTKILLAEDDATIGELIVEGLTMNGFEVRWCTSGKNAFKYFTEDKHVQLLVTDIMMTDGDGFQLIKWIRNTDIHLPILILSAKSMIDDRVAGLKIGADDYLVKPFSLQELVLKIQVFLKRTRSKIVEPLDSITIGSFTCDFLKLELVSKDLVVKKLTPKEANLIQLFYDKIGQIIPRNEILQHIWKNDDYYTGRSLDVFISRLRKYFQSDPNIVIENRHGYGFIMQVLK